MVPATEPISIVVPAYREAPNIEPLIRRTFASLAAAGIEGEMIIVDDDSGDGTPEIVRRLAAEFPVRVLCRPRARGLASAVLDGFARAAGDVFVVLDADLQHPPEAIPAVVSPITSGDADFVLGSRYAPGGATDTRWPLRRRLNSRVASLLVRPLWKVRDPMSGFFALRRDTWRRAGAIKPLGYKIGLELAVRAGCPRCREVPIAFVARHAGTSKLTSRQRFDYVRQLAGLYWFRHKVAVSVCLAIVTIIAGVMATSR